MCGHACSGRTGHEAKTVHAEQPRGTWKRGVGRRGWRLPDAPRQLTTPTGHRADAGRRRHRHHVPAAGLGFAAHGVPDYAVAKARLIRLTACLGPLAHRLHWAPCQTSAEPGPLHLPGPCEHALAVVLADVSLAGRVFVCRHSEPRRVPLSPTPWPGSSTPCLPFTFSTESIFARHSAGYFRMPERNGHRVGEMPQEGER
jgi:hypothetical protein